MVCNTLFLQKGKSHTQQLLFNKISIVLFTIPFPTENTKNTQKDQK